MRQDQKEQFGKSYRKIQNAKAFKNGFNLCFKYETSEMAVLNFSVYLRFGTSDDQLIFGC